MNNKNVETELKAIREICKGNDFSEEELLHRARLLYFINRLDFGKEMPILLGLIQYEVDKKKLQQITKMINFIDERIKYHSIGNSDNKEYWTQETSDELKKIKDFVLAVTPNEV